MYNFLLKVIILTILSSGNLLAMLEGDEKDLVASKRNFLVSGAPYDENNKSKGAMTLCFKRVQATFGLINYEYEHVALVFEMFFPLSPDEISVQMIHYGGEAACCGGSNKKPWIVPEKDALNKVYREFEVNPNTGKKTDRPTEYIKYVSWILPNKNLIKGYACASADDKNHKVNPALCNSYTSIAYVIKIMEEVGITNVDFPWWWRETVDNFKILTCKYKYTPNPSEYEEITFPTI